MTSFSLKNLHALLDAHDADQAVRVVVVTCFVAADTLCSSLLVFLAMDEISPPSLCWFFWFFRCVLSGVLHHHHHHHRSQAASGKRQAASGKRHWRL
ncbi:hypothetical protein M2D63_016975 [Pseudomonas sp. BJa5]|uniref:hypothetical protein n=1 Tax=Pseudomonas sp. BJa5 TaxID=2936270 RepID=UPI0025597647|nr:hypothetical protein [Pseudomonas sp. BGr12]MDL2422813.1 hypothetical protein [Pseudomonas sp. BGr12]